MAWGAGREWTGTDGDGELPAGFVQEFSASMPLGYRVLFDPRAVRRHAAISFRRGSRPAYAEVWGTHSEPSAALCVVAEDRPGLLSAIAAALVSHHLEVLTALVFSRATAGRAREAVDLFWVRRAATRDTAAIAASDATSIGEVVSALLSGEISLEQLAPQTSAPPPPGAPPVVVRFETDDDGGAVLFVDAPDRPGMLLSIARELFDQGAQIVRSLVRTADGRAFNRFDLTEFSGAPLAPERREQIRAAVLGVVALPGVDIHPRPGEPSRMRRAPPPSFIDVQLEPCAAAPDGLTLRFKCAGETRPVYEVPYESEDGLAGTWRVFAVATDDEGAPGAPAVAVTVEDSSDGTAWLVVGGAAGLRLEHLATGAIAREPYLVLAIGTALD
jgi:hypothetical protein